MERARAQERRADTGGSRGAVFTYHSSYGQRWENGPLAVEAKLLALSYRVWQQIRGAGKAHKGVYWHGPGAGA